MGFQAIRQPRFDRFIRTLRSQEPRRSTASACGPAHSRIGPSRPHRQGMIGPGSGKVTDGAGRGARNCCSIRPISLERGGSRRIGISPSSRPHIPPPHRMRLPQPEAFIVRLTAKAGPTQDSAEHPRKRMTHSPGGKPGIAGVHIGRLPLGQARGGWACLPPRIAGHRAPYSAGLPTASARSAGAFDVSWASTDVWWKPSAVGVIRNQVA